MHRDRLGEETEAQNEEGKQFTQQVRGNDPSDTALTAWPKISTSPHPALVWWLTKKHAKSKHQRCRSQQPVLQAADEMHACVHSCTLLPEQFVAWRNKWLSRWRWKDHQRQMLSALPEARAAAKAPRKMLWTTGVSMVRLTTDTWMSLPPSPSAEGLLGTGPAGKNPLLRG